MSVLSLVGCTVPEWGQSLCWWWKACDAPALALAAVHAVTSHAVADVTSGALAVPPAALKPGAWWPTSRWPSVAWCDGLPSIETLHRWQQDTSAMAATPALGKAIPEIGRWFDVVAVLMDLHHAVAASVRGGRGGRAAWRLSRSHVLRS